MVSGTRVNEKTSFRIEGGHQFEFNTRESATSHPCGGRAERNFYGGRAERNIGGVVDGGAQRVRR